MIKKNTKSRYIAGWEIYFEDTECLKKILLTQGIKKESLDIVKNIQLVTEIVIEDDTIIEAIKQTEYYSKSKKIIIKLPIRDWKDRDVFLLEKDEKGPHKLGGTCPADLKLPHHESLKTPFIYIGTIDTSVKEFEWMNLPRLDIVYPVYEFNRGVFLDYSNPLQPQIINPETFDDEWYDDDIKGVEKIVYREQKYAITYYPDMKDLENNPDDYLICGVPIWIQAPEIPVCPVTGEIMQYVCSINSDAAIDIVDMTGIENLPFGDYLIFGDHGDLYIFYHPVSKVLYLNFQF